MTDNDSERAQQLKSQLDWFCSLISASSMGIIFQELVGRTTEWMNGLCSALWWLDTNQNGFRLISSAEMKAVNPDLNFFPYQVANDFGLLSSDDSIKLPQDCTFSLPSFDLGSSLAVRIHYEDRANGILFVFPKQLPYSWSPSECELLRTIAANGAELCRNLETRLVRNQLVDVLQELTEKTQDYDLYDLILHEGKALLSCDRAVVRRVNLQNGHLTHGASSPTAPIAFSLPHGEGVTGLALERCQTYRIDDVTAPDWVPIYRSLWPSLPQARSELAVPILHRKYRVRVNTKDDFVDKPFGVLNFESPTIAAFSRLSQHSAEILAQRMAPVMERIEYDRKLSKVLRASQSLATKRDWDSIVDTLMSAIRDALGYEFVSLSIVDQEAGVGVIRCVRVVGLPTGEAEEFCNAAVHRLDSNHVQADVVRHSRIDVPSPNDPRLREISEQFGLDRLIRVFVPMKAPSRDEVIGSVSAGYDRTYRKHIFWRDVQLLRILVAFGTNAMESWHRGNIDRVSHEMNAPLTAVRGNLQRLRSKRRLLSDEQVDLALEDMETDTHLLYYQVQQLEYVVGAPVTEVVKQPLNTEPVWIFRDIIFKTLAQLKPLVRDRGLDPKMVSYSEEDVHKVKRMYLDKSKISQVFFNLFMNAVKYSESPETFKIRIEADDERNRYVIKFCDWGVGVPEGLEERIFEDRFRAPVAREVMGSGLGLTIARELMREHGGDLILKNRHKPTEFQLIFPKHLRRRDEDNVH